MFSLRTDAQTIGSFVAAIKNVNTDGSTAKTSLNNIYGRMKPKYFTAVERILTEEIKREKKWYNNPLFSNTPVGKRKNFILQSKLKYLKQLQLSRSNPKG